YCYRSYSVLFSFPTRRSSDLRDGTTEPLTSPLTSRRSERTRVRRCGAGRCPEGPAVRLRVRVLCLPPRPGLVHSRLQKRRARTRSEEHTSELQTREKLVCRLL